MARRDPPTASLPLDPFNRSNTRPVQTLDREGRVRLLVQAFEAMLAGEPVPKQAAALLGAAGLTWLEVGGRLEAHLGVIGKPRSRLTPARLYERIRATDARCAATATSGDGDGSIVPNTTQAGEAKC